MKCVVVGGGVIGLSIAYRLAQEGWQVELFDSQRVGRGASWAGAGILTASAMQGVDDPYELLRGYSHSLHKSWAERLLEETGIDNGFRRCGGWYVARSRAEKATLLAQASHWQEQGIGSKRVKVEGLFEDEPSLSQIQRLESDTAAWLVEDDCQLRNPRHLQALVQACLKLGVRIHESSPLQEIHWKGEKVQSVSSPQGSIEADHFCFTAGAWTQRMLEQVGCPNGIMPVRGQMLLYQSPKPLLRRIINEGHRYLVPREDGYLLVGSCEEEVGFVCETTEDVLNSLQRWARSLLGDSLPSTPVRSWAGLRPGSYDGWPYLGRLSLHPNLWFAAGHFRSGLHLSCGTAEAMVDIMCDRKPKVSLEAFRPDRGRTFQNG